MIDLTCENGILIYDSQQLTFPHMLIDGEFVSINLVNEGNDIWILLQENHTTINGVIQTSAQMIIDTLNNA